MSKFLELSESQLTDPHNLYLIIKRVVILSIIYPAKILGGNIVL